MTPEEKAKAYDKALERANDILKGYNPKEGSKATINYIFPELQEGGDERIKNRIIQAIKIREKEMNEEWSDEIAWLEKQGDNLVEKGYTNNKDVIEYAGNYSRAIWRKLMDNFKNIKDYHIGCNDVSDIVLNAIINTYNWLEKQGDHLESCDDDILQRFSFYSYKDEPNIIYLSELYINANHRNKGIGTKILSIADEVAASMGCNIIRLKAEIGSIAERLYRRNGYNTFKIQGNQVWLDKQVQKPADKEHTFKAIPRLLEMIEPTDRAKSYCQKLIDSLIKEGYVIDAMIVGECLKQMNGEDVPMATMDEQKPYGQRKKCLDCQFNYAGECKGFCAMKKGEQKLTDNFKPKFKVGDWVMLDRPVLITKVEDMPYNTHQYWTSDGTWFGDGTKAKLWTIQDAKEGDVFADDYGIYIFDRFDEHDKRCFLCMGAYQYSQKVFENKHMLCSVEVHPATKEQRDLLFQKMKESGYEWDAEKKKLKKIDNKPLDEFAGLTDFEKTLADICIGWIGEEPGWKQYIKDNADVLLRIAVEKFNSVQDTPFGKSIYQSIMDDTVQENQLDSEQINWLKFTSRVQPKIGWTKEDEKRFKSCLNILQPKTLLGNIETINTKWFKSLKQRYTWKPSDGQMEALKEACDKSWEPDGLDPLYTLYEDLEKLKGE